MVDDRNLVGAVTWLGVSVALATVSWRQRIIVTEDTLFFRYVSWHPPILLDHLSRAEFRWSAPFRELPRTVLRLADTTGETVDIPLRWWSGWRDLVRLVTELSGSVPEGPTVFPIASRSWSNSG